jgi:hypothetical protein
VPDITSSKIGTLNGKEIVQVEFDPVQAKISTMISALKNQSSFYSLESSDASPHFEESKYSLRTMHPDLYYLDLSELQAIMLNGWSYFGGKMPDVLTTEQNKTLILVRDTLQKKSTAGLRPDRTGNGLDAYRKQLLEWLKD